MAGEKKGRLRKLLGRLKFDIEDRGLEITEIGKKALGARKKAAKKRR